MVRGGIDVGVPRQLEDDGATVLSSPALCATARVGWGTKRKWSEVNLVRIASTTMRKEVAGDEEMCDDEVRLKSTMRFRRVSSENRESIM